jgi:hypothetical protein
VAKDKRYPSDLTDAQWERIEPQGRVASGDAFAAPDRGLGVTNAYSQVAGMHV